jgi:hypothetical protein
MPPNDLQGFPTRISPCIQTETWEKSLQVCKSVKSVVVSTLLFLNFKEKGRCGASSPVSCTSDYWPVKSAKYRPTADLTGEQLGSFYLGAKTKIEAHPRPALRFL